MLFRSGLGRIFSSTSDDDGVTWTPATPTPLPNPNSKISVCSGADGMLVLAYNHSTTRRAPLNVAVSWDGESWWPPAGSRGSGTVEEDQGAATPAGGFAYPTVVPVGAEDALLGRCCPGRFLVAYSYWGRGLRLADCTFHAAVDESSGS